MKGISPPQAPSRISGTPLRAPRLRGIRSMPFISITSCAGKGDWKPAPGDLPFRHAFKPSAGQPAITGHPAPGPGKPSHRRPADYAAAPLANPPPEWDLAGVPARKVSPELARWEFLKLPPASLDRTPANAVGCTGLMLLVPAKLYWPRRWRQRARCMGQLHGYGPVRPSWLCANMNCAAARDPPECLVRTEGEQSGPGRHCAGSGRTVREHADTGEPESPPGRCSKRFRLLLGNHQH